MSSISSLASGFDPNALVDQLVSLERRPILALVAKKSSFEAKISVFGQIKSLLDSVKSSLGDLDSTKIFSLDSSSSDSSVFTSSATSNAVEGEYQIKVNNLATSQTLYSSVFASATSEVADLSVNTTQKLRIQVGNGATSDILIDSNNNSLTQVKDAINTASLGITASIIDAGFTVDSSNKVLMFNDGTDRTATLSEGAYTADTLAAEMKRAMEEANGGNDTYTISYNTTSNKFTIQNDTGNTNTLDLMFENASTTIEGLLGYTATDTTALAVGSSLEANSAAGGFRLFLNSDTTGTNGRISIKVDEDNNGTFEEAADIDSTGLSVLAFNASYDSAGATSGGIVNLTQTQVAEDASFLFDGLTVTRSTNKIDDLITGVTFDLKSDTSTDTNTLKITKKTDDISKNLNNFILAYNQALVSIKGVANPVNGQGKILTGDATARNIMNNMRSTVTGNFEGQSLAVLGLSHNATGSLTLDSDILAEAINTDLDGVVASISKMAEVFETNLDDFINTAIPAVTDGYKASIKNVDNRIIQLDKRVGIIELGLRRKFLSLESLLAKFQRTSDFLSTALDSLPKPGLVGGNR